MRDPTMADGRAAPGRRGTGESLLALVRMAGFTGLLLAGTVLFVVTAAPAVIAGLGLGHLIEDLARGSIAVDNQRGKYLLALVAGLACCWLALPVALLAVRRLVLGTRRLSARWCGVVIRQAYAAAPPGRRRGRRLGMAWLGHWQRLTWLLGDLATWRDLLWLVVNAVVGLVLLLVPLTLFGAGVIAFIIPALGSLPWFNGLQHLVPPPAFPGNTPLTLFLIGSAMAAAGAWSAPPLLRGYGGLARWVLAPSAQAELELRVAHLARTRSESLDTGAAELRRIERDLHDGAQARLVAMGLTLDAAGRLIDTDPAAARSLLTEARDTSAKALAELRDLVRGVHPPVLADRGLADAVRALALDSPVRARVTGSLDGRPPAPVESAAYFAVSELLANVAKHAGAQSAEIDLRHAADALRITVRDDGDGGANPARGSGLHGIERRIAAFDGVLAISSPAGGPTMITMEIPCELS